MENLQGVWKIETSDKFDDYMKAIGVNMIMRMAGKAAKPEVTIEVNGSSIKLTSASSFKTVVTEATLDQEFDETTPDDRKTKTTFTMEGDKLIQVQKWGGKETKITRYINSDGKLQMDCVIGDVECKRVYVKK